MCVWPRVFTAVRAPERQPRLVCERGLAMSVKLKAPEQRGRGRVVPQRPHPVGDWKVVALRLAGGAVVLWGLFSLIGMIVTPVLVPGGVESVARGVEVWFAARRTGVWNSVTMFGAGMAESRTDISVSVVVGLLLGWPLGLWAA